MLCSSTRRQSTSWTGLVLGLLVMAVGTVFLLVQLDLVIGEEAVLYWPVALMVLGLVKLVQPRVSAGDRVFGGLLLTAGGLLQAHTLGYLVLSWAVVWPLLLVGVGLHILVASAFRRRTVKAMPAALDGLSEHAVFGSRESRYEGADFQGGLVSATFGGVELDLTDADFPGTEVVVDARAVFGGVEIKVPRSWRVVLKGLPIMGAFEDKTRPVGDAAEAKRLVITGQAVFGSVEVMN